MAGSTIPTSQENGGVIDVSGPPLGNGAVGVTPFGKAAAALMLGRPQPYVESGFDRSLPTLRKASRICIGASVGCSCLTSAALAAMSGVANDVPSNRRTSPVSVTTHTATPGAVKSGLRRPSAVGPREEKNAMVPRESSAPMASTESPSAGVQIERKPGPLLPAAVTTRMPRCAAMSAALVVTATSPFSSDGA